GPGAAPKAPGPRPAHGRRTAILCPMRPPSYPASCLRCAVALLVLALACTGVAQISVPTFGTRGEVQAQVVEEFMAEFRAAVAAATGLEVRSGELITPGIAGSLAPEFAVLIAELDGPRFAISRAIAGLVDPGGGPYPGTPIGSAA